jgi:hypothetical protein
MSRRIGRRSPPVMPAIRALLRQGTPEDLYRLGAELERYLSRLARDSYTGLPAPHTHLDDGSVASVESGGNDELIGWLALLEAD